jgi:hypothetical protein
VQALISSLLLVVALGLEGGAEPPTYGEVIEAMARSAAELGDSRLTALVSDVSLRCLERGEWARSEGRDTLRKVGRQLRSRDRAARRSRRQEAERKRAQRARRRDRAANGDAGEHVRPLAHEVLSPAPEATSDDALRRIEARDELAKLGFDALPARTRACLYATDVIGLRYGATAALLGLDSADQVRKLRGRALTRLRPPAPAG